MMLIILMLVYKPRNMSQLVLWLLWMKRSHLLAVDHHSASILRLGYQR